MFPSNGNHNTVQRSLSDILFMTQAGHEISTVQNYEKFPNKKVYIPIFNKQKLTKPMGYINKLKTPPSTIGNLNNQILHKQAFPFRKNNSIRTVHICIMNSEQT